MRLRQRREPEPMPIVQIVGTKRAVCPQCGNVVEGDLTDHGSVFWPLTQYGTPLCPDDRARLVMLPLTPVAKAQLQAILDADHG